MKLIKPVYEGLPYLYFLTSVGLLASGDSIEVILSATLFYGAGCVIVVTRSFHRRLDKHTITKRSRFKKYYIPEIIYEYLPYVLGAVAIFTLINTLNPYVQLVAFALGAFASRILLFRHSNRGKNKALF